MALFGTVAVIAALAFMVGRFNRHFLTCEDLVATTTSRRPAVSTRTFARPHRARKGPMP